MKSYHKYLLIALAFVAIGLLFYNTINVKYFFIGMGTFFGGIWARIDNIEDPIKKEDRTMQLRSYHAWIVFLVCGIYFIAHSLYHIANDGIL